MHEQRCPSVRRPFALSLLIALALVPCLALPAAAYKTKEIALSEVRFGGRIPGLPRLSVSVAPPLDSTDTLAATGTRTNKGKKGLAEEELSRLLGFRTGPNLKPQRRYLVDGPYVEIVQAALESEVEAAGLDLRVAPTLDPPASLELDDLRAFAASFKDSSKPRLLLASDIRSFHFLSRVGFAKVGFESFFVLAVSAYDVEKGEVLWSGEVEGKVELKEKAIMDKQLSGLVLDSFEKLIHGVLRDNRELRIRLSELAAE